MNATRTLALACIIALALAPAAWADWTPDKPAKWVQFPDLGDTGLDVRCGPNFRPNFLWDDMVKTLADDFECYSTGPITSVHIWGSWLNDDLPMGMDPGAVDFELSLHKDIPASESPTGYSIPDPDPIWDMHFPAGSFQVRMEADNLYEQFYDPNQDMGIPVPPLNGIIGQDTVCWQYNFDLAAAGTIPPVQEGTPDRPIIYWLDVTAFPHDDQAVFGWKTSLDHWNDDAVYWDDIAGADALPKELRYPMLHPYEGDSIDLAFVIVPEPATMLILLGGGALAAVRRRRR